MKKVEIGSRSLKPVIDFPRMPFNSFTTKKQTTKYSSANFQKKLSLSYIILRIQRLNGKQCRYLGEVAHYEPPPQDLRCLQSQLFSSLVTKELKDIHSKT